MILDHSNEFLDQFFSKLNELGIDVSKYELDHLAYQAKSNEDYDSIKQQILALAEFVDENIVNGRRVSIFELHKPLNYKNYSIPVLELIAPKEGQICPSALEHGEFVIDEGFESFLKKYPDFSWDTSSINQPLFPLLKLRLGENMLVKFHYEPVIEIVKHKNNKD